ASGHLALETLAAWHPSRGGVAGPLGLLPGRVHLSVQPTDRPPSRETVLPAGAAGCLCRPDALRGAGQARAIPYPAPAPPQHIGVTLVKGITNLASDDIPNPSGRSAFRLSPETKSGPTPPSASRPGSDRSLHADRCRSFNPFSLP